MKNFVDKLAPARHGLWLCEQPLILASRSRGRWIVLQQAGIPFEMKPADIDERGMEAEIRAKDGDVEEVVASLARAKALKISHSAPQSYVVGSDQAASCEGRLFGKPNSLDEAAQELGFLSGRAHFLHSAIVLARGGKVLYEAVSQARMTMRSLDRPFIDAYLRLAGDDALASAGAYRIEGLGAHLFAAVEGDHWTILGLPLLMLLDALRREGALLS